MVGSRDAETPPAPTNVLIVDDNLDNRVALKSILASPAYRLVEAGSGAEALRHLLTEEFAVVLIDVVMPRMNGFELAATIKQRERTAAVPIVFLTAQAQDLESIHKGYGAGAVDYLVTPLVPEIVRAKVAVFAKLDQQRKQIEEQAARLVEAERYESDLRLAELRIANERRFRGLADAVPHIVWTARSDGTIDYFNQRWFEYTGLSVEESSGTWFGALHPDEAPTSRKGWQEAQGAARMWQMAVRLRARDGSYRWHLARAVPELGIGDDTLAWVGTFTDIEDQKRAERSLAEFKETLDAVHDAVMIFEPEGERFLYANQGTSTLLARSRDEVVEMRPLEFMSDYAPGLLRELLAPLLEDTAQTITLETQFRRKDGQEVPVELLLQHMGPGNGSIVSIARDVTERKRSERERELLYGKALEALKARDDFLSVASHELRTPLTSLKLQVGMLVRPPGKAAVVPPTPEQVKAKLAMAERQIDRLAGLVAELLDVSRIRTGRLELELDEVDLAVVARDVVTRFSDDAAKANSTVTVHAEHAVVARVDRARVDQVITNLLTNALKFGAGRPIEVTVEEHAQNARVTVRDHGIGIPPEHAERIFERFERGAAGRAYGGLGLGLYIVRQIVAAHSGSVHVESAPGAGSTFTVTLPRERPPAIEDTEQFPGAGEGDAAKNDPDADDLRRRRAS